MMNRILCTLVTLFCVHCIYAQEYKSLLIGYNQSLPVISDGIGYITATYDGEFLRIEGVVENLEGNFENGVNGGVALYLGSHGTIGTQIGNMLPFVDEDGKGFELLEVANRFELTPDEVLALNNNELYINVGTDLYPEGEIRAQIVRKEDQVYYCSLFGSQVTHPYTTLGHGTALLTIREDSLRISGAFRDLSGDFDMQLGGANLKSAYLGSTGTTLANLVVQPDTVSNAGIIRNADNIFSISSSEQDVLLDGGIYIDIYSDTYDRAELRGQALPAAKQLYLANLRSYNTLPASNSRATGKIIIQRNHGDSLYLSGGFQSLESPLAVEFAGGTILYNGNQGQEGSIKELLVPSLSTGNTFGVFHSSDNFFEYLPADLQKLDNHDFFVTIHSQERFFGEVRGQLLPLGQNNFTALMNDIQTENVADTDRKAYVDAVQMGDEIKFSGSIVDSIDLVNVNSLSLRQGLPGVIGQALYDLEISLDENNNATIINPDQNQFEISEDTLLQLFDRGSYLSLSDDSQNEIIRGQLLPTLQSIYFAPMSDRQQIHEVDSKGSGMLIVEQHADSELVTVGSFKNLGSQLSNELTGNILINDGKYGEDGTPFRALISDANALGTGGTIPAAGNRFLVQASRADSLQLSGLFINILTQDEDEGEIRGQVLEIADGYYNTRLDATNVITESMANGTGQLLFLRKDDQLIATGSFSDLDGIVNFSNNGGVTIRNAEVDKNGDIKFLLFPEYSVDSLAGTFSRSANTLFLESTDVEQLRNEKYYLEVRKTSQEGPALRGQIQNYKNVSPNAVDVLVPVDRDTIIIDGLETDEITIDYTQVEPGNTVSIKLSERPDFQSIVYTRNFGINPSLSISYKTVDSLLLDSNVTIGDTLRMYYRIINSDGADTNEGELRSLYFVRGLVTGVPDIYKAHLTANHSVPPKQSTAYGDITAELLDSTLRIRGQIDNLMGDFIEAKIHVGLAGEVGDFLFDLNSQELVDGSLVFGTIDNTFALSEGLLDTLNNRGLYINVTTTLFSDGEVRGQILPDADQYYYANLIGSNVSQSYNGNSLGALSIEVTNGEMTVTGSYNNLGSPYDIEAQGGSQLHLGLPGEIGPALFALTPIEIDSFNGVYLAQNNIFEITDADLTILNRRSLYADVHSQGRPDGAIRGMVSPILKGTFRSNLGSLHHRHISNDHARGVIQVDLDIDNNIGIFGSFYDLPSTSNDFDGLMKYRYGFDEDVRDILDLNVNFENQDSTSGTLLVENNNIVADENMLREMLYRAHHINIDVKDDFGGIRGQVLGISQQYYTAKLNGYQMIPSQGGGDIKTIFIERVSDQLLFSGSLGSESSRLSMHQEVIGVEGAQISNFAGEPYESDYLINPLLSNIISTDSLNTSLQNLSVYLQYNNVNGSELRGQVVSNARYIHLGIASGIEQLFSINTPANGRCMMISSWDDNYSFTGSVRNLTNGLNEAIAGGMHLHFGLPGISSNVENEIVSTLVNGDYVINRNSIEGSPLLDSMLMENRVYFDVHSIDFPNGEIRSQMRPLSNYYYTSTLNGGHVVNSNSSPALGKMLLDITDDKKVYYGSYSNLAFPLGSESDASSIAYNLVYEPINSIQNLSLTKTNNSSGVWNAKENIYRVSQLNNEALQNKILHVSAHDVFDNVALRGRMLEAVNQFADANLVMPSILSDTLHIEGDLDAMYNSTWLAAIDDEELMYKFQLSTNPAFTDIMYEQNTLNDNQVNLSYVQLLSSLSSVGIASGDTVVVYQRVYITDGSEDSFSNVSSFVAIPGVVENPVELYRAYLSGYQQKSPVVSRGQGFVDLVLQGNVLTLDGAFSGLESSIAEDNNGGALLQIGLAGTDGQIMLALNADTGADASNGVFNEFENIYELNDEQINLIRNRETYINIYSDRYVTGELRGQILPIADDYYLSSITASQSSVQSYVLDAGHLILEVYSDSIWITGSVDHNTGLTYGLFVGLAGQHGQKIMDLISEIDADGNTASFLVGQNKIENTPGIISLLQNREIYIADTQNDNVSQLRGQILPEIRSAFYANLSGLKTINISNSFGQGNAMLELGKEDEISISGSVNNLEGTFSNVFLSSGLPGVQGSIVNILAPIISADLTAGTLTPLSNIFAVSNETLSSLFKRELYLQVNTDDLVQAELRGQFLALAPMYAECVITGSQISADNSSQAHGLVEMELHPQEINAVGSISNLPMEIDNVEYINATAALEGSILRSMIWESPADGLVTMSIDDNQQMFSESLLSEIENNRVSIVVHSPEYPLGVARGILMPPAQGLFLAPLSSAALTERTDNAGSGIAMLILRNSSEVKFVSGITGVVNNSLRFRFGLGLPGVLDNNPFTYLGFQQDAFGGVAFNNNIINNFTEQIVSNLREGLHHVKISSNTNNSFQDIVRGQLMPIGYQSYQGTFTNYHPQGTTNSTVFGKVKGMLNGNSLNIIGSINLADDNISSGWIGQGGVNETSMPLYPIEINDKEISLQTIELSDNEDLSNLANKKMHITLANDQFPNGVVRAQLMPDINYYPAANPINLPNDEANILLQGGANQELNISWTEIESPDDLKYVWELAEDENFENVLLRVDRLENDFISFSYFELDSILREQLNISEGDVANLYHRVVTTDGSEDTFGEIFSLSFTIDELVSVTNNIKGLDEAVLLPNVSYGGFTTLRLNLSTEKNIDVSIYNSQGLRLFNSKIESLNGSQLIGLDLENLTSGNYKVVLTDDEGGLKKLDWIVIR